MSEISNAVTTLKVKKLAINGTELDYYLVILLEFYESLVSPGITGTIQFKDFQGIKEIGGIKPGDVIDLTYSIDGHGDVNCVFLIYADGVSEVNNDQTFQSTSYAFCSPWMFEGFLRQVSKPFKQDMYVHEIVDELLKEVHAPINFIEESKTKLNNFVTPLWTVPHSIKYLSTFAKNLSDKAGYILWEDIGNQKLNWTTVDYLFRNLDNNYIYPHDLILRAQNLTYEGNMHKISLDPVFNIVKSVHQGLYSTRNVAFNFDGKEVYTTKKNVTGSDGYKHRHISKKLPLINQYTDEKWAKVRPNFLFPSNDSKVDKKDFEDMVEGNQFYRYTMLFSDIHKINAWVSGSPIRRIGHIVKVIYPSIDESDERVKENKEFTGYYLIRNIRHVFRGNEYMQALTLISDGYKESKADFVAWS